MESKKEPIQIKDIIYMYKTHNKDNPTLLPSGGNGTFKHYKMVR